MDELHTGPKYRLNGTEPDSYFKLHVVPLGYQPKGEGDCWYQAQYRQAYSGGWGSLALVGCPPVGGELG